MKQLKSVLLASLGMVSTALYAQQLDIDLQLRPRGEYRNGYKTILNKDDKATSFISQRSRLNVLFTEDKLKVKVSLQNVRVWGDVPPNTTFDKNGIAFFEAYGQYQLHPNWLIKVGRQVLSYDNQRILGEIDWTQQAQSHDAIRVGFKKKNYAIDIAASWSADAEDIKKQDYKTKSYKSMQYAWFHTDYSAFKGSFLLLNTGYEFTKDDAPAKVNYMQTAGTFWIYNQSSFYADAAFYTQLGKREGASVKAWNLATNLRYNWTNEWKIGLGYEYLSGKRMNDASETRKSFTPLFGTNHAFNGYMDYFYVGNHLNTVGLSDFNSKLIYEKNKYQLTLMPHVFYAAASVVNAEQVKSNSYLGTEIDFTGSYQIHKNIALSLGYSQMLASSTLEYLKGGTSSTNNWAWLSLNINPRILSYKK